MREIKLSFNWIYNNIIIKENLKKIINGTIGFTPHTIIMDEDYSFKDGINIISEIRLAEEPHEDFSFIVTGYKDNLPASLYFFVETCGEKYIHRLVFSLFVNNIDECELLIDEYIDADNLIFACLYDYRDVKWQSETRISEYEQNKISYSNLPKTKDRAGRTIIDVSNNVGRMVYVLCINFVIGSRMYFGESFNNIISVDNLKSLHACELKILQSKEILIFRLFDLFHDSVSEIREKQKEFDNQTGFLDRLNYLLNHYPNIISAAKSVGL